MAFFKTIFSRVFEKKHVFADDAGFTLLEILLAIGIFTGILFVITTFGLDVADFGQFLGENLTSQQELQQVTKTIKTEIRSMGPSNIGGYPIESASASSLVFYSDFDNDGLFERIRYYLESGVLKRGVIIPSGSPLAYLPGNEKVREEVHYVIAPDIFSYYPKEAGSGGSPLSSPVAPSLIRLVKINLTIDENPQKPPAAASLTTVITIRNLRGIL